MCISQQWMIFIQEFENWKFVQSVFADCVFPFVEILFVGDATNEQLIFIIQSSG